jgi:hypothetical protein
MDAATAIEKAKDLLRSNSVGRFVLVAEINGEFRLVGHSDQNWATLASKAAIQAFARSGAQ